MNAWCNQNWPSYFLKQGGLLLLLESDEAAQDTTLFSIINERFEKLFTAIKTSSEISVELQARYAHQTLQVPELSSPLRLDMAAQAAKTLLACGDYVTLASPHPDDAGPDKTCVLDVICRAARASLVSQVLEMVPDSPPTDLWPVDVIAKALYTTIEHAPAVSLSTVSAWNVKVPTDGSRASRHTFIAARWLSLYFFKDKQTEEIQVEAVLHEAVSFHEGLEMVAMIELIVNGSKKPTLRVEAVFSCNQDRAPAQSLRMADDVARPFDIRVSVEASFRGQGARVLRSHEERIQDVKHVILRLMQSDRRCFFKEVFDGQTKKELMLWEIAQDKGLSAEVYDLVFPPDALRTFRSIFRRYLFAYYI